MEEYADLIEINEPMISAQKVLERWSGIDERDLAILIELALDGSGDVVPAYHVHRVLSDGKGNTVTECLPYKRGEICKGDFYDFTGLAFYVSDILEHEKACPKVLYKKVENSYYDDAWGASLKAKKNLLDNTESTSRIGCPEKKLHQSDIILDEQILMPDKSPSELMRYSDVIEIFLPVTGKGYPLPQESKKLLLEILTQYPLNDSSVLAEQLDRSKNIAPLPEITHQQLSRGWIESKTVLQLLKAVREMYDYLWGEIHLLSTSLLQVKAAYYMEKDMRIKFERELEHISQGEPETVALKTEKATQARQERTLNAWKPTIDAMIKVAVRCGEEGRVLRQQPDFNAMFNELDAVLNNEQIAFFRKALPDEHIDRTGGPKGKGTPS